MDNAMIRLCNVYRDNLMREASQRIKPTSFIPLRPTCSNICIQFVQFTLQPTSSLGRNHPCIPDALTCSDISLLGVQPFSQVCATAPLPFDLRRHDSVRVRGIDWILFVEPPQDLSENHEQYHPGGGGAAW